MLIFIMIYLTENIKDAVIFEFSVLCCSLQVDIMFHSLESFTSLWPYVQYYTFQIYSHIYYVFLSPIEFF